MTLRRTTNPAQAEVSTPTARSQTAPAASDRSLDLRRAVGNQSFLRLVGELPLDASGSRERTAGSHGSIQEPGHRFKTRGLRLQRFGEERAAASPGAPSRSSVPAPPESEAGSRAAYLVDDDAAEVTPEQMRKSDFLNELKTSVCNAAEEALSGTFFSAMGCPWVERWFEHYGNQDAAHVERALRRYAPGAREAMSARDYIPIVTARVRRGISEWSRTGEVTGLPEELQGVVTEEMAGAGGILGAATGLLAGAVSAIGGLFFKSHEAAPRVTADPVFVQSQLGAGNGLDPNVRGAMETAFGHNFSAVRVHTDGRAAELSNRLHARAFTVGSNLAFATGEYQPGTPIGDALIAHELAHVVQQGSAHGAAMAKADETDDELEEAADRAAVSATASIWGLGEDAATGGSLRLAQGLRLQRCSRTDQRAGTTVPGAERAAAIRRELSPISGGGEPWDGATDAAKRDELRHELTDALAAFLQPRVEPLRERASERRLQPTQLEGAGAGARRVADEHFRDWAAPAALTPSQADVRSGHQFRGSQPGQNLFDITDPAQRRASGMALNPLQMATALVDAIPSLTEIQARHHFDHTRSAEEGTFLRDQILTPFITDSAHREALELFERFAIAGQADIETGNILVQTRIDWSRDDVSERRGEPSPAERFTRWSAWKTLVHEYLHVLTHPTFHSAAGGRRVMLEGFTEMFAKEVLLVEIPRAPENTALRQEVEGGDFGPPSPDIVGPYRTPPAYVDYLQHAENVRDTVIGGRAGENAVKAAFFQGHVEFLGLNPDGSEATPSPSGTADFITVPAGVTTLVALSDASGVSEDDIRAANPGLGATGALPAHLNVPGCRDHIVVAARDAAGTTTAETKAQIAAQNGVSESALERANPGVDWNRLTAGQRLLIPRH